MKNFILRFAVALSAPFLFSIIITSLIMFSAYIFYPNVNSTFSISGSTQVFEYRVFDVEKSKIFAKGFALRDDNGGFTCVKGSIIPPIGAIVIYKVILVEQIPVTLLEIELPSQSKTRWLTDDNAQAVIDRNGATVLIASEISESRCGTIKGKRLPVWGSGRIGANLTSRSDGENPILLKASVDLFGHSARIFNDSPRQTYQIWDRPRSVAPGSILSTYDESKAEKGWPLRGFATSTNSSIDFAVSTQSEHLKLSFPGLPTDEFEIRASFFEKLLNEPVAQRISLISLIFFSFLQLFSLNLNITRLSRRKR